MPELPEVETVRRSLLPIVGARIEAVEVREPRLRRTVAPDFASRLTGRVIQGIERRGKYLLFQLSADETLLTHLGMSGALLLQPVGAPLQTHDHVSLRLSDGRQITFNDPRRFGLMRVGRADEFVELGNVGPDPLSDTFSLSDLAALARGRKKPVKNLLMDQRALGGVGNIYANEILFRAGIRPGRQARRLTRPELERLLDATRAVLRRAIRLGGSSISDYRDSSGRPGYFQLQLKVYDRAGKPCLRCRTPVRRVVHAGRSSFYCPACQR
ncbi:MAG TPA: bifunctional DNA-formamidopyrimidine glycosylase/DNA-(apurinic or apyrimidinic site) lyase [Candidatus Margulisiibacteriota bacterium]|nr:bifunctional DNA-formamidopyrimidine glycosylase/DNA-(apurinic or apyrimidinic site) lyase [Candidatus Margulisiibacteriota bacterium]